MSKKLNNILILKINHSLTLSLFLVGIHGLGAGWVGALPLSWPWRAGLWVALLLSLIRALRLHGVRTTATAISGLRLNGRGELALRWQRSGEFEPVRLVSQFIHPWLVVLVLRSQARYGIPLIIVADAVGREPFRRLRAQLLLRSLAG